MTERHRLALAVFVFLLLVQVQRGGGVVVPGGSPTAAVYIYEQREHVIPSAVKAGLNAVNRSGIKATTFDVDTISGTGKTPTQYEKALAAGREAGLPALVVLGGDRILRVVPSPQSEADVTGAVK